MHNNDVITAPVSLVGDVAAVLGDSSTDLGTLCQSSKINMWAKYKPVPWDSVTVDRNSNWFKGNNGLCGLNIPTASGTPDDIYNLQWGYAPPSSYFRLGDFDGYSHQSTFLLTGWLPDNNITLNVDDSKLYVRLALFHPTVTNNLQIADCDLLSNIRLALKIVKNSNKYSYLITSEKTALDAVDESGILQVILDFKELVTSGTDTFTITQFLTTTSSPTLSTFPTIITCYSIPNYWSGYTNRINVSYSAVSPGIQILCTGLANALNGTYNDEDYYINNPYQVKNNSYEYWQLSVQNLSSQNKTITVNQLKWTGPNADGDDKTSTYDDDLKMYNSSKSEVQSLTINAGSTTTMYIRSRIFSKNVTMSSGMGVIDGIWHGLYTSTSDGFTDRLVGRFETSIQGSI